MERIFQSNILPTYMKVTLTFERFEVFINFIFRDKSEANSVGR